MFAWMYLVCCWLLLLIDRPLSAALIPPNSTTASMCSNTRIETACGSVKKCWVWNDKNYCYRKCQRLYFKTCNGDELLEKEQTIWKRDRIRKRSAMKTMYRYRPGYDPHPPHDLKKIPEDEKLPGKYVWDMLHSTLCHNRCVTNLVIDYNEHCERRWLRRRVCYLSDCVVWREGRYCKRSGCVVRRIYNKCYSIIP